MAFLEFVRADWPETTGVRAVTTTRVGGASAAPFDGLNLGDHVGDDPPSVARTRAAVSAVLELPGTPRWLNQVHGTVVARGPALGKTPDADAAVTHRPGEVLAILTADCLPV
ncbi:MAG: laccase domain-containing protein, partial [Pseudomonadota bacterium]